MAFFLLKTENMKRNTSFPVTVSRLFSCDWRRFPTLRQDYIYKQYEITLRYDSSSKLCMDKINGQTMGLPFPNVVFKYPGMKIRIADDSPRSAIGFSYSAEVIGLLRSWGMFPEEPFLPLTADAELKRLIRNFLKFTRAYPTFNCPGDRIDDICFSILREIMFARSVKTDQKQDSETPSKRSNSIFSIITMKNLIWTRSRNSSVFPMHHSISIGKKSIIPHHIVTSTT